MISFYKIYDSIHLSHSHFLFTYFTKWVRLVIFGELKGSDPFNFPLLLWRQLAALKFQFVDNFRLVLDQAERHFRVLQSSVNAELAEGILFGDAIELCIPL